MTFPYPTVIDGNLTPERRVKDCFKLNIRENTIRTALHEAAYHRGVARHRPYLNTLNRKRWAKFVKEYKDWTVEPGQSAIFC